MIPSLYEGLEYVNPSSPLQPPTPVWTLLGRLRDALSCVETSSINSEWELVMEYPILGVHADDIRMMRIIYTTQPFFVYRITKDAAAHTMTVYARHINYLLSFVPAWPINGTDVTLASFISRTSLSIGTCFQFITDETTVQTTASVHLLDDNVPPSTLRDLMLNERYGAIALYGGEWVFDGLTCALKPRKGETKNITIKYGVDLIDAKQEEILDSIVTHIIPYAYLDKEVSTTTRLVTENPVQEASITASSEYYYAGTEYVYNNETLKATPHLYLGTNRNSSSATELIATTRTTAGQFNIYALPGSSDLPFVRIAAVNVLNDMADASALISLQGTKTTYRRSSGNTITTGHYIPGTGSDTRMSSTYYGTYQTYTINGFVVNYANLRTMVDNYVNSHPVEFPVDITVRSLPEFMAGVKLGDTITVEYPDYGISTQAEIMTMEYDVLREQIASYTLGKGRTSFAETMLHQDNKIQRLDGLVTARNPLKGT